MTRFVVGDDRSQSTLFPERLEDYLSEDNPVRAIDVLSMSLVISGSRMAPCPRPLFPQQQTSGFGNGMSVLCQ
jgi:hypothetical protein